MKDNTWNLDTATQRKSSRQRIQSALLHTDALRNPIKQ